MAAFPVIYEGHSYDIKEFLRDHPGGINTLEGYKGKSVLQAMEKFGHSTSAYHILKDFKVSAANDVNLTGSVSKNGRIITKDEGSRNLEEIQLLEELESRLDYTKPILSQLHLVASHYSLWVNTAIYKRCILFENPLLERMTFTPWYVVPLIWVPVILFLWYSQFIEHVHCENCPLTTLLFICHILFGMFIWTGLEYVLHRWLFHRNPGNSLTMMKIHFLLHGLHHKMPFDGLRQVFPPVPTLGIYLVLHMIVRLTLTYPVLKSTGGLLGYLIYDMIHFYVHHGAPRDGSYLYAMKRYHSNHHFINHDKAFGISTEIWDHVFKTFVKVKNIGFSLRW